MKTSAKLISLAGAILLSGAIVLTCLGDPAQLNAQRPFSVNTVRGTYGFHIQGWIPSGAGLEPVAQIGQIVADGFGRMSISLVMSANGDIDRGSFTASYEVNPDGTGSLTPDPGSWAGPADFTIVDSGKQLFIIATTEGTILSGVAVRQ